jgi:hypothetical protein
VLNEAAFGYLRSRGLAGPLIARLADAGETCFVDQEAWRAHLKRLGIVSPAKTGLAVIQDPVQIATEGAQWGSIHAHSFLRDAVVLSDDGGQFDIGRHALCWVQAAVWRSGLGSIASSAAAPTSSHWIAFWRGCGPTRPSC